MAKGRDVLSTLRRQLAPPDQLAEGVAVVIDVLRATTTIVHALAAGCQAVRPCAESRRPGSWPTPASRPRAARRRTRRQAAARLRPGQFARENTPAARCRGAAGADHDQRHLRPAARRRGRAQCWSPPSSISAPSANNCGARRVLFISSAPATAARWRWRTPCWPGRWSISCATLGPVRLNDGARLAWDCFEHHGRVLEGRWRSARAACVCASWAMMRTSAAAARGSVRPGAGAAPRPAARRGRRGRHREESLAEVERRDARGPE